METRRFLSLALFVLFLCWSPLAVAQQATGRIAGQLVKEGRGVGGVTVLINETKAVAISDNQGRFSFSGVPVGSYTVIFTLGDHVLSRTDVSVSEGATTRLDVEVDWDIGLSESLTVYSASRRTEKIVDAPSAVSVISAQQIETQAAHGQLPKVLEFTPGAEVTQSGIYDFNFNTRGFNSSVNRRVAVYLDGRNTAAPFLGAQEWSALSTPLDDLTSVEFVRGPSAALYGANASSGVINMTSKSPRDSQGGTARLTGGQLSTGNFDVRWAGELGKGWYYKLIGGLRDTGDFTVSRNETVEYSRPCSTDELLDPSLRDTPCLPKEQIPLLTETNQIYTGGLRFDKYLSDDSLITLEGGYADIEGPVFQTGIGRIATVDSKRPWARIGHSRPHWNVLAYYSRRDAQQQSLQSTADLFTDTKKYSIELQTNWDLGQKGRIVAGGAYTEEKIDTADPSGQQTLLREAVDADFQALFAQFDWRFNKMFKLVLAGRVDAGNLFDTQYSPKAALLVNPSPSHTLRFTYNEAFQVANYSEFFLFAEVTQIDDLRFLENLCESVGVVCGFDELPVYAVGNSKLDLEETQTGEIGYSAILGRKAFLTVDVYKSNNELFITDLLPQVGTELGSWVNAACVQPGQPRECCTGPGTGTCSPLNPEVPEWVAPAEWEEVFLPNGQSLADTVRVPLNFLTASAGAQASNAPDGSTIVVARSYTNFGLVDTQGVDMGLQYYFSKAFNLNFAFSWFDWEPQEDDPDLAMLLLPNTPEYKVVLGLNYQKPRWGLGISGRWVDDFLWSAGIFEGPVMAYTTVDLDGNYHIDKSWTLGFNIANLGDNNKNQSWGGDLLGRRALVYGQFSW